MKAITLAAIGMTAAMQMAGQAINYNSSKSNSGNIAVLGGAPTALLRYTNTGALMNTVAQMPGALAMTKVLGNYLVTTGATLYQISPTGTITPIANALSLNGLTGQWVSLAPDGLGNVVLADNHFHAVWLVNLQTNAVTKVASYPVGASNESEDVAIAVDPASGNYIVLEDNSGVVSVFSITPGGTVTQVTLTGTAARSSGSRLIPYNGAYVFASASDNAVYTLTPTTPLTIASPAATVAELAGNVCAPTCNPTSLGVNPDTGDIYVGTNANTIVDIAFRSSGNILTSIVDLQLVRDVMEETYGELPYLAVGNIWTTGVYVVNTGNTPASYAVNFYGPNGNSLSLPVSGAAATGIHGTLPPHGMTYVEASNPQGALQTASGLISADATISIQALFRDSSGGTFYEGSVPSSLGGLGFSMPFDFTTFAPTGAQLYTGLAIANSDPLNAAALTCVATNQAGTVIPNAVAIAPIAPLGLFAGFQFPALYGISGTMTCSSSTRIAAIGVRSLGSTFSTLPVLY